MLPIIGLLKYLKAIIKLTVQVYIDETDAFHRPMGP